MARKSPSKPPCPGSPTKAPLLDVHPLPYDSTDHGRLELVAAPGFGCLRVLHLYGSAYEMGRAQGTLLRHEIVTLYDEFLRWFQASIDTYMPLLPRLIQEIIRKAGVEAALELMVTLTRNDTPRHFVDEMRGLSATTGVPPPQIHRLQMFPELVNIGCTILGAWGPASSDGRLVQLRALDWGLQSPLYQYPLLIVYHPSSRRGHPYAVLTWPGLLGALTGFSGQVGMSQKDWVRQEPPRAWLGIPAHFLLADVLRFDRTVKEAIARIRRADRTCTLFVGLGDHQRPSSFRLLEYDNDEVIVFTDRSELGHPAKKGILYLDKYRQPSGDPCLPGLVNRLYGDLSVERILREVVPASQTGDLHLAVYDYREHTMAVGVARMDSATSTVAPAYLGPFVRLDMTEQFGSPGP